MRVLLLLCAFVPAVGVAQTRADMQCKAAGKDLIYNCTIRLARADQPVEGAQLTVGAAMPSMPDAHSAKPVKARPGKGPGEYLVRLDLDMPGEWDVKLRLSAPVRDQVVLRYEFDERGGRPLRRHK
ncbi:MAG TPA: FixH family protein [Burkholderiales bacterium]|nr:FixH family protein [Burkholderiales bacterium]